MESGVLGHIQFFSSLNFRPIFPAGVSMVGRGFTSPGTPEGPRTGAVTVITLALPSALLQPSHVCSLLVLPSNHLHDQDVVLPSLASASTCTPHSLFHSPSPSLPLAASFHVPWSASSALLCCYSQQGCQDIFFMPKLKALICLQLCQS